MSRTIRRANGHDRHDYLRELKSVEGVNDVYLEYVNLEGDARKRKAAIYHGDAYFTFSAPAYERREQHQRHRARARQELSQFYKNQDHEVQIRSNPRWPYWL